MRILLDLLRLFLLYFFFWFIFKSIVLIVRFLWRHPGGHRRRDTINDNYDKRGEDRFDYKNVIDAEFKEIKK